ncbi:cell division protein FtsL [Vulcanibacillus modesticaldus]|uniref:Cell division protein FtsL n=1 Tax=Vulcanibacillus modesticaldus TaxID=337097 RepID=A0A1D2YU93_9BACI|nr:cell division protein FtsL [Vulcanibacillus modesticaldus]OEF99278.1 cell division protein FtsL [Vulcanibacillus modesticaldus]
MTPYTNGNLAVQFQDKDYKNKRIIKKTKKKSIPASEKLFYLFSILFIAIVASVVISGYAQIAEYNYTVQKLEKSIADINHQNEILQMKIAELSSPERILEIAQNELGMTLNEEQVIVISQSIN